MFYKILDDYIELYKLNGRNALENMKSHYDCEEEHWAIIEELLDRYIDLQSKIDKAIECIEENIDLEMDDFTKIDIGCEILRILDLDKYNEFLKEDK